MSIRSLSHSTSLYSGSKIMGDLKLIWMLSFMCKTYTCTHNGNIVSCYKVINVLTGVLVDVLGDLYGGSNNNTQNGTSTPTSMSMSGATDNIKK